MLGAVVPMLGLLAPSAPGSLLVGPGYLNPALTLGRAHTPGTAAATRLLADGSLAEAAANQARFTGSAQALLIETQRQNLVRNPRAEGAVAGTPGTLPAGWSRFSFPSGITTEVAGTGVEDGIPYVDLRITGSPVASGGRLQIEAAANVPGGAAQAWAASIHASLADGSLANLGLNWGWYENDSGGAFLRDNRIAIAPTGAPLRSQRHIRLGTTGSGAAQLPPNLSFSFTAGAAVNATLRLGAPQMEAGTIQSSVILPAAGSPAAATRAADVLGGSLAAILPAGIGTILWKGVLPQATGTSSQYILQVDDDSDANRFLLFVPSAAGSTLRLYRSAGAAIASVDLGTFAPGAEMRLGMAFDAAGRAAASLNGAAAVAVTGGPASGSLSRLRLAHAAGGASATMQEIGALRALPDVLGDAELAAAVATL
jgi:hypothetical protein